MHRNAYHGRQRTARAGRTRAEQVQHRRFVLAVIILAVTVVVTAAASHPGSAGTAAAAPQTPPNTADVAPSLGFVSATYTAELKSLASDHASEATVAILRLDFDAVAETLAYRLEVTARLADPSVAAICQTTPDGEGTTVFTLFPGPSVAGDFSGVLARGTIAPENLVGSLQDAGLADLLALIESGRAYATVGTLNQPIDAAKGPIR